MTMSKRFIQLTSGWIPVSVLLLFAAALVTGQTDDDAMPGIKGQGVKVSVTEKRPAAAATILGGRVQEDLHTVRYLVGSIRQLSEEGELTIDVRMPLSHGGNPHIPADRGGLRDE